MDFKKINKWLKDHDFETKCVKCEDDIYYDQIEDVIHFHDLLDLNFYRYVSERVNFDKDHDYGTYFKYVSNKHWNLFSNNTVSLLHELGHAETLDDIGDIAYAFNEFCVKVIEKLESKNISLQLNNILDGIYFRLPVERAATKWAINYMQDNYEAVIALDKIIWK